MKEDDLLRTYGNGTFPIPSVFQLIFKADCTMQVESCTSADTFHPPPTGDASFSFHLYSDTGRNAEECNMEGCSWVTWMHFARSRTVPFNSCALALQLVLICIAAEVIPVNVSWNWFIYQQQMVFNFKWL